MPFQLRFVGISGESQFYFHSFVPLNPIPSPHFTNTPITNKPITKMLRAISPGKLFPFLSLFDLIEHEKSFSKAMTQEEKQVKSSEIIQKPCRILLGRSPYSVTWSRFAGGKRGSTQYAPPTGQTVQCQFF